jgi:hypothetical protein
MMMSKVTVGSVWRDREALSWSPWATVRVTNIDLLRIVTVVPLSDPDGRFAGRVKTFSEDKFKVRFCHMHEEG